MTWIDATEDMAPGKFQGAADSPAFCSSAADPQLETLPLEKKIVTLENILDPTITEWTIMG